MGLTVRKKDKYVSKAHAFFRAKDEGVNAYRKDLSSDILSYTAKKEKVTLSNIKEKFHINNKALLNSLDYLIAKNLVHVNFSSSEDKSLSSIEVEATPNGMKKLLSKID